MSGTSDYGKFYWIIKLANGQEMGVYADRMDVTSDGSLVLYGNAQTVGAKFINLALAAGGWQYIYAASEQDGTPLAVGNWTGHKKKS